MHTVSFPPLHSMAISPDDRAFFVDLGSRISAQRKDQGITQVQLAEILGVSQQAMNSFEKGRRRVPVSLLPAIARAVDTSIEALIGEEAPRAAKAAAKKKRGPAPKIQQQLERVAALPKAKQRFVSEMLDSVLAQARR